MGKDVECLVQDFTQYVKLQGLGTKQLCTCYKIFFDYTVIKFAQKPVVDWHVDHVSVLDFPPGEV